MPARKLWFDGSHPASRMVAGVVLGALLVGSYQASACGGEPPEPGEEFFPKPSAASLQVEKALGQQMSIDFHGQPLADVMEWCEAKLKVPVILDLRALADAGIGGDTPVTKRLDDASAKTALSFLMEDLGLRCVERDGVLVVTSPDVAETMLVTRVYPVADLTPLAPVTFMGSDMGGGDVQANPQAPKEPSEKPESKVPPDTRMHPDFDSLIQVITATVRPQSWDEVGGAGAISELAAARSIVVLQTRDVHEEVLELLRALRAAKRAQAAVPSE